MSINFILLGKHIKEVRLRSALSQIDLADESELSMQFISNIETGKRKISLDALSRIADALGVTIDELLSGNQLCNPTEYITDIDEILASCSQEERRYVYLTIDSMIKILKDNSWKINLHNS